MELTPNPTTFADLGLNDNIIKVAKRLGIQKPTSYQSQIIPLILQGKSIIAQGSVGCGKNSTFVLGMLQLLDPQFNSCQAILVEPDTIVAKQTWMLIKYLTEFSGLRHQTGSFAPPSSTMSLQQRSYHIMIGTAEYILESFQVKQIKPSNIKILLIDEADLILEGEERQNSMAQLVKNLSSSIDKVQICIFSNTISKHTVNVATKLFGRSFETYLLPKDQIIKPALNHYRISNVDLNNLASILRSGRSPLYIIFVKDMATAKSLKAQLDKEGEFKSIDVHEGYENREKEQRLTKFRTMSVSVLITTDNLNRGIRIRGVCAVINFDMAADEDTYIHRSGRIYHEDNSAGARGGVYNFIKDKTQRQKLNSFELALGFACRDYKIGDEQQQQEMLTLDP